MYYGLDVEYKLTMLIIVYFFQQFCNKNVELTMVTGIKAFN